MNLVWGLFCGTIVFLIVYKYDNTRRERSRIIKETDDEEKDLNGKPTIYTYIDETKPQLHLEEVWTESWNNAGWNTKILNMEDSSKHPDFEKMNYKLDDFGIDWIPKQSFYRFLAMATIPNGGFFAELNVFPLSNASRVMGSNLLSLPNDGSFTCYDESASILSGSFDEWNRILDLLYNKMNWNAFLTLRRINFMDDSSFILQLISNTVEADSSSADKFQYESICFDGDDDDENNETTNDFVKFSSNETSVLPSFIMSWFKIRRTRCFHGRPKIFTFFEPTKNEDLLLLQIWKQTWSEAGWEPVVLNLDDARHHPNYDELLSKLLVNVTGTWFYNGKKLYNLFCFLRWIAMASIGGGWMSDYDTLPLYSNPSYILPNNGSLTVHTGHVPNLVSGSALEWNRIAQIMFDNYDKHSNHGTEFWSDMLEMDSLLKSKILEGVHDTVSINDVYDASNLHKQTHIEHPYNLNGKCKKLEEKRAIHFSHSGCYAVQFCHKEKRAIAAKHWHKAFVTHCAS